MYYKLEENSIDKLSTEGDMKTSTNSPVVNKTGYGSLRWIETALPEVEARGFIFNILDITVIPARQDAKLSRDYFL